MAVRVVLVLHLGRPLQLVLRIISPRIALTRKVGLGLTFSGLIYEKFIYEKSFTPIELLVVVVGYSH